MSRTSRAFRGTLASFLQYGLQLVLQVALAPFLLRVAGQETLGAYAVLLQAIGYLSLTDLGFSISASRYLAQAYGWEDQGARFQQVMSTARTFTLFSNILFASLCLALSFWIGSLMSLSPGVESQVQWCLCFLAAWSIIRTPLAVYGAGLIATQHLAAFNIVAIVGNAMRLILSLGLVAAGFGLVGLILANILAELVSMSLQWRLFDRRYPGTSLTWSIPDRALMSEMFRFGLNVLVINLATRLILNTDNLVVGYLYGVAAASIYYTTQMPATFLYQLVLRVADNASPAINELYARNEKPSLRQAFLDLQRYSLVLATPVALGILLLSRPLIDLWVGSAQYGGNLLVASLALFAVMIVISHSSVAFVIAQGRIRTLSLLALLEGLINLLLSLLFGLYWGLGGVTLATVLAHLITGSYVQWRAQKDLSISMREYLRVTLLPLVLPTSLGTAFLVGVKMHFPLAGWTSFFGTILAFLLIFTVITYCFSFTSPERLRLRELMKNIFSTLTPLKVRITG